MNEQKHWLLRPQTIRILWGVLILLLVLTLIPGFFVHPHAAFGIESTFGFYAWYGFLVCVLQVLLAKFLGIFFKRSDTYYDD